VRRLLLPRPHAKTISAACRHARLHAAGRGSEQSARTLHALYRCARIDRRAASYASRPLFALGTCSTVPLACSERAVQCSVRSSPASSASSACTACLDRHRTGERDSLTMLPYIWPAWRCCTVDDSGCSTFWPGSASHIYARTHATASRRRSPPSGNEFLGATAHVAFPSCVCSRQVCGGEGGPAGTGRNTEPPGT
jgi:hypothetical protein